MQLRAIRIQGYVFRFPGKFSPGDRLSESEAQALNSLRAENIRNNVDGLVKLACSAAEGDLLSTSEYKALQEQILAYAQTYEFQLQPISRPKLSQLEVEIQTIAYERALASGLGWDSPDLEAKIESIWWDEDIQREAREALRARGALALQALNELAE